MGASGVWIILNPRFEILQPIALVILVDALRCSAVHVATKPKAGTEDPLTALFYMRLIQSLIGVLLNFDFWGALAIEFWLGLVSDMAFTCHYCIAHAMRSADSGVTATLDFLRLWLITVAGVVGYNDSFEFFVDRCCAYVIRESNQFVRSSGTLSTVD